MSTTSAFNFYDLAPGHFAPVRDGKSFPSPDFDIEHKNMFPSDTMLSKMDSERPHGWKRFVVVADEL